MVAISLPETPRSREQLADSVSCHMIYLGSGEVLVCSLDEAIPALAEGFSETSPKNSRVLKGHTGPISCIYTSADLMERSFLLTGGADCSARIWNIE